MNKLHHFLSRSYMNTNKKREFLVNRTQRVFKQDALEGSLHILSTFFKYGKVSVGIGEL